MTKQKQTYAAIINRVTDGLAKLTIGRDRVHKKVLFFAAPHFLFLISKRSFGTLPFAHQKTNRATVNKSKSQIANFLGKQVNKKVYFHAIKGNNLVSL